MTPTPKDIEAAEMNLSQMEAIEEYCNSIRFDWRQTSINEWKCELSTGDKCYIAESLGDGSFSWTFNNSGRCDLESYQISENACEAKAISVIAERLRSAFITLNGTPIIAQALAAEREEGCREGIEIAADDLEKFAMVVELLSTRDDATQSANDFRAAAKKLRNLPTNAPEGESE